jgi:hypothetical protein
MFTLQHHLFFILRSHQSTTPSIRVRQVNDAISNTISGKNSLQRRGGMSVLSLFQSMNPHPHQISMREFQLQVDDWLLQEEKVKPKMAREEYKQNTQATNSMWWETNHIVNIDMGVYS